MKIFFLILKVENEEKFLTQTKKIENNNQEENKKEIEKERIEKNEKIERIEPPAKITKKKKGMIKGLNINIHKFNFPSFLLIEIYENLLFSFIYIILYIGIQKMHFIYHYIGEMLFAKYFCF